MTEAQDPAALIDLACEPKFALGGLEVRPPTRELVAGAKAELLEPRVMQVLVALARRRGAVVSRDDLIASCWDGRAVGDDAINRCIQAIRRLAQAHGGFAITTVSRVGYRLDESALPFAKPAAPAGQGLGPLSADTRTELRRLTVLACDLYWDAPTSLGAEDWYDIAAEYRRAVAGAVGRFGGHVTRGLGEDLRSISGTQKRRKTRPNGPFARPWRLLKSWPRLGRESPRATGSSSPHGSASMLARSLSPGRVRAWRCSARRPTSPAASKSWPRRGPY
jgi:DNA-binding winged helix-turn-helix (wHTH) protein